MSAAAGPGAGDVTYTYSTTLSQPLEHADGAVENAITLTGVTVQVTDSDSDTLPVSFNVTIVDDVPQAVADDGGLAADGTAVTYNVITNAAGTNDLQGADAPATLTAARWRRLAPRDGRVLRRTAPSPLRLRRVLRALGHQLHDHRPGRRHLVGDGDGDGCGGFCSEPGVDDQPDG